MATRQNGPMTVEATAPTKKKARPPGGKELLRRSWRDGTYAPTLPKVAKLLRRLDANPPPAGAPLDAFAQHIFSQHREDGVTYELLKRAGMTTRRCVEIGSVITAGTPASWRPVWGSPGSFSTVTRS